MSDHISRKELKQDKVRETFEHGAEAVLSHTTILSFALLALVIIAAGYFGWHFYSQHQESQAQIGLDDAMKIFAAPLAEPGQPTLPGEFTYADPAKRAADAQVKFVAVADHWSSTKPGRIARYYSALCLMDQDKLNQAAEELKRLQGVGDKEMVALAKFQTALIAERNGKKDEAVNELKALSTSGSVLVPKAMVLLEMANVLSQTDPKQATTVYEQLKKDYPNTSVADQADRGLELLASKS